MARDPGSVWSPLPEADQQGSYVKNKFIVHSTGDRGSAAAIYRYFSGATPNESTFVVGRGPEDPTRQLLDSSARADANVSANQSGISVEVVGTADDDYTEWQVSEIVRLGRWSMAHHPIPRQIIPSPTAGGFGWHVMFGAPGPWAERAKSCPGKQRIAELKSDIFPAIFNDGPTEEFTVAQFDEIMAKLEQIRTEAWQQHKDMAGFNGTIVGNVTRILVGNHTDGDDRLTDLWNAIRAIAPAGVDVEALKAAMSDVGPVDVDALVTKLADEADRRARDGDSATGPTS